MDVWRDQRVLGAMPKWGRRILWFRPSITVPRKPVSAAAMALRRLRRAVAGVTAIEYALLGSLLAVVIIGAVSMAGSELKYTFEALTESIAGVNETVSGSSSGSNDENSNEEEGGGFPDPCQQGGSNCGNQGQGNQGQGNN